LAVAAFGRDPHLGAEQQVSGELMMTWFDPIVTFAASAVRTIAERRHSAMTLRASPVPANSGAD